MPAGSPGRPAEEGANGRCSSRQRQDRWQGLIRRYVSRKQSYEDYRPCPFVPTPLPIIEAILARLDCSEQDVFVDLGCGDGRVALAAAKRYNCRCIGVEHDERVISRAHQALETFEGSRPAAVNGLVHFLRMDFFDGGIGNILNEATIVWLFLTPRVQKWLLPILLSHMNAGSRIVCYVFPFEEPPQAVIDVNDVIQDHQLTSAYVYNVNTELKQAYEHRVRIPRAQPIDKTTN